MKKMKDAYSLYNSGETLPLPVPKPSTHGEREGVGVGAEIRTHEWKLGQAAGGKSTAGDAHTPAGKKKAISEKPESFQHLNVMVQTIYLHSEKAQFAGRGRPLLSKGEKEEHRKSL